MKYLQTLSLLSLLFLMLSCEEEDNEEQLPLQEWTYTGLGNRYVVEVEVKSDWVYAATQQGMYKQRVASDDTLWTNAGLSGMEITDFVLLEAEHILASVSLDNNNPSNTLYMSHDGGANWTAMDTNFGGQEGAVTCQALDYDPNNPQVIFGRGNYNVAKSTDGGQNWTSVFADWGNIGYQADLIKVYDEDPDVVWAGGETSIFSPYMIKSTDGGQNWQPVQVPSQGDNAVYSMVIHPNDPQQLLAGMEGQVIASQNGGSIWEIVLTPDNYSYFLDLQMSLEEEERVYAAGTDGGNDLGNIIIYTSNNFGEGWSNVRHQGQEGKQYAAHDLGLYSIGGQEAMYVATNHGVFIYKP